MKLTIKTNEKFNDIKISKDTQGNIYSIEIDFEPSIFWWSDMEFWLNDSKTDKFIDYAKMCLSKTNKMRFYKR